MNEKYHSLLPLNAKPIEHAIDKLGAHQLAMDLTPIDTNPYTCSKALLPELATAWRVDISDLDEHEQRHLIANALEIHRYKGTVYAVQTALDTVFDNSTLIEHIVPLEFDASVTLKANTNATYDPQKFVTARRLVNSAKSAHSRFINFDLNFPDGHCDIAKTDACTINLEISSQLELNATSNVVIEGVINWTL